MHSQSEKRIPILIFVTLLVVVVLAYFSFISFQRLIQTDRLRTQTTLVISHAEQVIKSVVDIETGQRGYVITGDPVFLEPFYEASREISTRLHSLDSLTFEDPIQNQRVKTLYKITENGIGWANRVVETRNENFEQAQSLVLTGRGKQITDSARALVNEIQRWEQQEFVQQNTLTAKSLQQLQGSFTGLAVAITLFVAYLFYTITAALKARNKIQQQLTESAEEIKDLYNHAPCGYHSLNAEAVFIDMNETELAWLGYTREEVIGKLTFTDLLTAEGVETFQETFKTFKATGKVTDLEFDLIRKNNTILPVVLNASAVYNAKGEFVKSRSIIFDNTARKEAEKLNAEFKAIVESSEDAIISLSANETIMSWNKGAENLYGYTREEVQGKDIIRLVVPEEYMEDSERIVNIAKQGKPIAQYETVRLRKDGSKVDISLTLSPIYDKAGNLVGVSKIAHDISNRKKREQEIQHLNQELDAFSYSVSHDLRAPLRSITGYAQILLEDHAAQLDAEGLRVLHIILRNGKRMGMLIDDLLNFSKLGRKKLTVSWVPMEDLVKRILSEMPEAGNGMHVETGPLLPALADYGTITQVWANLISNAIKYSGKNPTPKVEIGSYSEGTEIIYYVRDNGVGFDMKYYDKLFGVFQRLHKINEFEGTGVGLALVKRIVERHHGRIWAEGKLNEGATFCFSLPGGELAGTEQN